MRRDATAISPITEIISEIRAGRIVILVDDEDRENEGDLVFAADFVSADKINFLTKHGRGLVCMPITEEHAARLGLRPMVEHNRSRHGTNFTVSIEAAEGIATGISAHDRALTIRVAASPDAKPEDIVQPGHVFPLIASIEVKRKGDVRRAKLYYLRARSGKSARIREKTGDASDRTGAAEAEAQE